MHLTHQGVGNIVSVREDRDMRIKRRVNLRNTARSMNSTANVGGRITASHLEALRSCADGNTLRFVADEIVEPLIAMGYLEQGVGRVCYVTDLGHQYLRMETTNRPFSVSAVDSKRRYRASK